ncbi:MAG: hypothetical protein Kow00109_11990 [Acidobacteriota bacterium]
MAMEVKMPPLGESVTEGIVARWLKQVGDEVEKDEALVEITTDKVDTEIPAPESGTLVEILVPEGETVPVGGVLARLEPKGAERTPEAETAPAATATEKPRSGAESLPAAAPAAKETFTEQPLSPVARTLAREHGLTDEDLAAVKGSGRGGRITKEDILQFLAARKTAPAAAAAEAPPSATPPPPAVKEGTRRVPMTPVRKMIAEHMVRSKRTSPHTYTVAEVDMTRIVQFRETVKKRFQETHGFSLTYTHFILHAVVTALQAHPLLNCSVDGDEIVLHDYVHLGVAVALDNGLIVPVIKHAEEKNLLGLARSAHELAAKAQAKKLSPDDVQGGTFTVTNPGVFGNIFGLPIINQPQVAILGVGAIKKRPVVVEGDAIAVRSMMYLSLSYDHRVIDGAEAARFLQRVRNLLETYDTEHAL